MRNWLTTIWNIALFRAGPQDLPAGNSSLVLALAMYSAVVAVAGLVDERAMEQAGMAAAIVVSIIVSIVLPLVAVASILGLSGLPARFGQTSSALFGTGALIGLVNAPLWFTARTPIPTPLVILALVSLLWSLAVDGHIWRNALNVSYAGGLMVAVLILLVQLLAFQAMGSPGVS